MRDLYATTLQLIHLGGEDPFVVASQRAIEWAWRVKGDPPDLQREPNGSVGDFKGTGITWSSIKSKPAQAIEIRLRHPDAKDNNASWNASVVVTEVAGSTRATIRLSFGAAIHTLVPSRISVRAPSIATALMEAPLLAYAGSV